MMKVMEVTMTTTHRIARGQDRFPWWDWWLDRKRRYVRDARPQLDADTFRTLAVGTGLPDISQRSNFAFHDVKDGADRFLGMAKGGERPFARIYTRLGNPTTEHLERVLFQLEAHHVIEKALAEDEQKPTIGTLCFSSGMGAISALLLSVLRQGDAVVLGSVYGCTDSLARNLSRFGITARFVDVRDADAVAAAVAEPDVAMLFVESPENPTLHLCDIEAASRACEAHGVLFAVDNTFCSPWLQQPFRLGADVVIHSLTKFINGHSASIAGAMLGPFPMLKDDVFGWYKDLGATPSPFDAWLNSLTTQALAVRQSTQSHSAQRIAEHLASHPAVAAVHYPGLPSHPQHALAMKQMRDGGSLIAFELKGGMQAGVAVMNYFARKDTPMELAVSLGGAISYVQHPASMTHSGVPELDRHARGISDGLVRLSVGLEGTETLLHHLDRALAG
jgi:methionine-gamma-lyase